MNRVVSLLLGLNNFTILERKTLTANDRNLQYMNIKIDDEIDIEDYSLLIRYKQVDGKIFADVYSIEKDNDIQIPNSILEFPQTLTIEFCYISNKNDNRITIPRKLQLNVIDTYDTIVEPDDVVIGVSVADIVKEIPKKTEEGKAEIKKCKDEAIEELKKCSDSNVEESKEQINSFTSQKQEQLDVYTNVKKSQLDEYTTTKNGELDSHTVEKKNELNAHEKAKEKELDNYVITSNKPKLDEHTESKKGVLDTHTGKKKIELDVYEKAKEGQLDLYANTKKEELNIHEKAKEKELDTYVTTVNKPELDEYTNIKKEELNSYATTNALTLSGKTRVEFEQDTQSLAGKCDGKFPFNTAHKGLVYLVTETGKFYICIKEYSGGFINTPDQAPEYFEELSVFDNYKKIDNMTSDYLEKTDNLDLRISENVELEKYKTFPLTRGYIYQGKFNPHIVNIEKTDYGTIDFYKVKRNSYIECLDESITVLICTYYTQSETDIAETYKIIGKGKYYIEGDRYIRFSIRHSDNITPFKNSFEAYSKVKIVFYTNSLKEELNEHNNVKKEIIKLGNFLLDTYKDSYHLRTYSNKMWQNIKPIKNTIVTVETTGNYISVSNRNLFNGYTEGGYIDFTTGDLIADDTRNRTGYIPVVPNENMTVSREDIYDGGNIWIIGFDKNKKIISDSTTNENPGVLANIIERDGQVTFTTTSSTYYIRIYSTKKITELSKLQVEFGSDKTSYIKHKGYITTQQATITDIFDERLEIISDEICTIHYFYDNKRTPLSVYDKTHYINIPPIVAPTYYSSGLAENEINKSLNEDTKTNEVYAEYDKLVDGTYCTKELLTQAYSGGFTEISTDDGFDKNIYAYRFKPAYKVPIVSKPLKIVIVCCQHGDEKMASYTILNFLKKVCNNPNDSITAYIRSHVDLVVIPIANPWGFNYFRRKNQKGVDLNRNYPASFPVGGYTNPELHTYGGKTPLSEKESQAIVKLLDAHKDAIFVIDYHSNGWDTASIKAANWVDWTYAITNEKARDIMVSSSAAHIARLNAYFSTRWKTKAPIGELVGDISVSNNSSLDTYCMVDRNTMSCTFEAFPGSSAAILGPTLTKYSVDTKIANVDLLAMFLSYSIDGLYQLPVIRYVNTR